MSQFYQSNLLSAKTNLHKTEEDINNFLNEEKKKLKLLSWNKLNRNTKLDLY